MANGWLEPCVEGGARLLLRCEDLKRQRLELEAIEAEGEHRVQVVQQLEDEERHEQLHETERPLRRDVCAAEGGERVSTAVVLLQLEQGAAGAGLEDRARRAARTTCSREVARDQAEGRHHDRLEQRQKSRPERDRVLWRSRR